MKPFACLRKINKKNFSNLFKITHSPILSIIVLVIAANLYLFLINTPIIHAQADFMAPGVPYHSSCYIQNKVPIKAYLQTNNLMQINEEQKVSIKLKNLSSNNIQASHINFKVQYPHDLLQVSNITINKSICNSDNPNLIENDVRNGSLYINLPEAVCGKITLSPDIPIEIATFNIIALKKGKAKLTIDTQDTSNGTKILLANANAQASLQTTNAQQISIIQAGEPSPSTGQTTTQPTTTPPSTGILNSNTLIFIIMLSTLGLIIKFIPLKHKIMPIEYVEQ